MPSQTQPKSILFDLDDTLINTTDTIAPAWEIACRELAGSGLVEIEKILPAMQLTRLRLQESIGAIPPGRNVYIETAYRILEEAGIGDQDLAAQLAGSFHAAREMAPFPGVIETLCALQERGVKMGLITSGGGDGLTDLLVRIGLRPFFDHVLGASDLGYGKPGERIFREALGLLDTEPEHAWMVGDSLDWDVAGAQAIGILGIWVVWPASKFAQLQRLGPDELPQYSEVKPDRIIRHISELLG